jgi:DNA-binding PadR family transcriptional regulator
MYNMNEPVLVFQKAFLLAQLFQADGQRLQASEFSKKLKTKLAKEKLSFDQASLSQVLRSLVQDQYVAESNRNAEADSQYPARGAIYQLTEAGVAFLEKTEQHPAVKFRIVKPTHANERLLAYKKAFLLLQIFRAKDKKLNRSQINAKLKTKTARESVALDAATTDWVLKLLGEGKYITGPRRGSYQLTESGTDLLAAMEHYPSIELTLTGSELNSLLAAVRESSARSGLPQERREQPDDRTVETPPVPVDQPLRAPEDLAEAILREFEDLLREKYGHTGMVPIHDVRRRIAERFGPEAARHEVFDAQVRALWQQERLQLVPISNSSEATAEQLSDSIQGVNETFFYLETAHEQVGI